jgi:tetratricopeptide (TPR) repeat protein
MSDGKLILSGLPPLNTLVRVSERPPFTAEPRKLKPIEQAILRSAREGAQLATVVSNVDAEKGPALRACYGLYAAGLLEPATEGERRPLKVQEETGHFVLSEIQQKFAKIRATNARQEILMEFDRLDRANDHELLQVEGNVEEDSLRDAYERRLDEWEEKRAMVEAQHTLVAKVDVIRDRLRRAYEKMREESEPEAAEPEPPLTPPPSVLEPPSDQALPPLNEELFDELGIDVTTPPEAVPIPEEIFSPPPAEPFEPTELSEEDVPEEDEPAAAALVESVESAGSEEAEAAPESQEPAVASERRPAAKLYGAARVERVRQLLRDVKLHFQVRDWEHAVSLLYELVELEPEEAKHHAMLARAMARHPVMRKDAERHFIEALRLKPQDADVHFSLGLYYKSFGMHARAQTEFRTALRINPRHEGATKHLSAGRNAKDPLRDVFKKIFG